MEFFLPPSRDEGLVVGLASGENWLVGDGAVRRVTLAIELARFVPGREVLDGGIGSRCVCVVLLRGILLPPSR